MRALALALLVACSHGSGAKPEPIGNTGSAAPASDAAPADASACVTACIQRNQMRATGPEVIAAGCRTECGER